MVDTPPSSARPTNIAPTQLQLPPPPNAYLRPEYGDVLDAVRSKSHRITFPDTDLFEGTLRGYQHDGVAHLYLTMRLLLGDSTGLGKTVQTLRYLAELKRRDELSTNRPAVVGVPPNALDTTWMEDGFDVFMPGSHGQRRALRVVALSGDVSPADRRRVYETHYPEVILLSYPILIRDYQILLEAYGVSPRHSFSTCVWDEGSAFKSHGTRTAQAVKVLGSASPRSVVLTATPVETQLLDLHSLLEALQLGRVFGTKDAFERRYYNMVTKTWVHKGHRRSARVRSEALPYVHLDELRERVRPFYFRRTYTDVGSEMPSLSFSNVWVDLEPRQRRLYDEVQRSALPPPGPGRRFHLQQRVRYLKEIATSVQTFKPDALDVSSKLDWLIDHLQGDWNVPGYDGAPLKVVVYSSMKHTIITLMRRLDALGIGAVVMAGPGDAPGDVPFPYGLPPSARAPLRARFSSDPSCRVLIGTSAIERSLNFPVSPLLVNLDLPTNPARLTQLAGRVWRASSKYRYVHVINLLATHTVEAGILRVLEHRQTLIDTMNGEPSEMFKSLSNDDLERLATETW